MKDINIYPFFKDSSKISITISNDGCYSFINKVVTKDQLQYIINHGKYTIVHGEDLLLYR